MIQPSKFLYILNTSFKNVSFYSFISYHTFSLIAMFFLLFFYFWHFAQYKKENRAKKSHNRIGVSDQKMQKIQILFEKGLHFFT